MLTTGTLRMLVEGYGAMFGYGVAAAAVVSYRDDERVVFTKLWAAVGAFAFFGAIGNLSELVTRHFQ